MSRVYALDLGNQLAGEHGRKISKVTIHERAIITLLFV
jgi:hypothetical protein